jgi:hypothetical protein
MNRKSPKTKIIEGLDKTTPSDFDGHTDFISLTPEQKIRWLSGAAQFYFRSGAKGRSAGRTVRKRKKPG